MNWKAIIGIILLIVGLGAGVLDWVRVGLAGNIPVLGLVSCVIGGYLVITGLFKKKKKEPKILGELGKIGAVTAGFIIGTIAYEKFSEYLKDRTAKQSVSDEELINLEKKLDLLYLNQEIEPEKYAKAKTLIIELKKKRNLA